MDQDFHRIKRLPPYVFNEVNEMKANARALGKDIIDFGMGNPDQATPQHIVNKLVETVSDPRTHRYSASRGIPGLRRHLLDTIINGLTLNLMKKLKLLSLSVQKKVWRTWRQRLRAPGMLFWFLIPAIQFICLVLLSLARQSETSRFFQIKSI